MKTLHRLLDADPTGTGGGSTTAAPTTTTQTVTTQAMAPREPVEPEDNFLDEVKIPPVEGATPPTEKIVVDPAAPVVPPVAAPVTYSPEQVAELIKRQGQPAAPAARPPAKPLTPEEIDAQLNTFKPAEADVQELLSGDPVKATQALLRMGAGMVKNAVTVANLLAQDREAKFQASLEPHIKFAQEHQARIAQQSYFEKNPNHKGLEPLIAQVAEQLVKEGFKGNPEASLTEVSRRVEDLRTRLKIPVPEGAAPGTTPAAAPSVPAPTRMSTVSTGGQGGAGGAGTEKGKDPEAGIWS